MIRDVNLIEHLPPFLQEFREYNYITDAENPEFQLVSNESERIKNNQFIESSDLVGIAKFEKLLNIVPLVDDTLEARISRVLTRWNDAIPYTYRSLIERLEVLCGQGNYTIELRPNLYELDLKVYLPFSGQVNELEYMLSYIVPANIVVTSSNVLDYEASGTIYTASTSIKVVNYKITSELNTEYNLEGKSFNGSTMVKVLEYTIN